MAWLKNKLRDWLLLEDLKTVNFSVRRTVDQLTDNKKDVELFQKSVDECISNFENLSDVSSRLSRKVNLLKENLEELEKNFKSFSERVDGDPQRELVNSLSADMALLENMVSKIEMKAQAPASGFEKLEKKNSENEEKISQVESIVVQFSEKCTKQERELSEQKKSLQDFVNTYVEQNKKLQVGLKQIGEAFDGLELQIEDLRTMAIVELSDQAADFSSRLSLMEGHVKTLRLQIGGKLAGAFSGKLDISEGDNKDEG